MTNDKAATDEQIAEMKAYYEDVDSSMETFPIKLDTLSLIARIEALQAENAALKTALDELLDWVNGERRTSDDRLAEIESMLPSKGSSHE